MRINGPSPLWIAHVSSMKAVKMPWPRIRLLTLSLSVLIGCGNPGAPTMPPVGSQPSPTGAAPPKQPAAEKKQLTAETPGSGTGQESP